MALIELDVFPGGAFVNAIWHKGDPSICCLLIALPLLLAGAIYYLQGHLQIAVIVLLIYVAVHLLLRVGSHANLKINIQ
jgi:hypothetical protein